MHYEQSTQSMYTSVSNVKLNSLLGLQRFALKEHHWLQFSSWAFNILATTYID